MPLLPAHERAINPRTGKLEIVRENPIDMLHVHETGRNYYWQNGQYFLSPTGDPVDPSEVPEIFRRTVESREVVRENRKVCPHCAQLFPESKYAGHLEIEMVRMAEQMVHLRAKVTERPADQDDLSDDIIPSAPVNRQRMVGRRKRGRPRKIRRSVESQGDGSSTIARDTAV